MLSRGRSARDRASNVAAFCNTQSGKRVVFPRRAAYNMAAPHPIRCGAWGPLTTCSCSAGLRCGVTGFGFCCTGRIRLRSYGGGTRSLARALLPDLNRRRTNIVRKCETHTANRETNTVTSCSRAPLSAIFRPDCIVVRYRSHKHALWHGVCSYRKIALLCRAGGRQQQQMPKEKW